MWLQVQGGSMLPLLHSGMRIHTTTLARGMLPCIGDIVLVERPDGYLCHRVVRVERGQIYTRGDALARREGPFATGQIAGKVRCAFDGSRLVPLDRGWRMWYGLAQAVLATPLLRLPGGSLGLRLGRTTGARLRRMLRASAGRVQSPRI